MADPVSKRPVRDTEPPALCSALLFHHGPLGFPRSTSGGLLTRTSSPNSFKQLDVSIHSFFGGFCLKPFSDACQ